MISPGWILRRAGILLVSTLVAGAVFAAPINVTYIGTWSSTGSGNPAADGGPSISAGQRFVISITYDDASVVTNNVDVPNAFFTPSGASMSTISLQDAGNSLDIFVPMEGFDGASPFVYTQNESNHFFFGDNSPVPTLNFANGSSISDTSNIIGLEFEGDFVGGAQQNVIELFNTSADGSTINMVSQVLNLGNGGIAASDTSVQGTSLVAAVDLDISAGSNVTFDAGNLTQSTSSAVIQSNDLGAARSDNEDFIDASWSVSGTEAGANGNDIAVSIANSGLTSTTDSVSWNVTMTEQFTGTSDADSVIVSYMNSTPSASATATATATGTDFTLSVVDLDEIVNSIIAGFENVVTTIDVDGMDATAFFNALLLTGSQSSTDAALAAAFGLGVHTLTVTAVDLAGAIGTDMVNFEVFGGGGPPEVPEPATLALLLAGLLAMFLVRHRRRTVRAAAD